MSSQGSAWNTAEAAAFWKRWEGLTLDGKFRLSAYLGGAANHAVFLTEYYVGRLQRAVIKLMLADAPSGDVLLSRWKLVARLSHPHLAPLLAHGSGHANGADFVYTVTEYAEENLAQVLAERQLTIVETQEMLEALLNVLAYIHGEGFTHGHLKPANIMAVEDRLKISSDSLCPLEAPEHVTPSGDIRDLGVLLSHALTGQSAPSGTLPQPFLDIVRLCLRSNPDERPTAAALAQRLRQPAIVPRARTGTPRYLVWAFLIGLAAVALLLGSRLFRGHSGKTSAPASSPSPTASAPPTAPAPVAAPAHHVPRAVLERALPDVPPAARNTIHGSVRIDVRVRVDPAGNVVDARYEAPPRSAYLGNFTLQAARRWKFQPGSASQEWLLRFQLFRTGTNVTAVPMEEPVSRKGGRDPKTGK